MYYGLLKSVSTKYPSSRSSDKYPCIYHSFWLFESFYFKNVAGVFSDPVFMVHDFRYSQVTILILLDYGPTEDPFLSGSLLCNLIPESFLSSVLVKTQLAPSYVRSSVVT